MKACWTRDALFTDNATTFILSETEGTDGDRGNAIIAPAQDMTIPYNPQTTPLGESLGSAAEIYEKFQTNLDFWAKCNFRD